MHHPGTPVVARICEAEGMLAHKITADVRETRYEVIFAGE